MRIITPKIMINYFKGLTLRGFHPQYWGARDYEDYWKKRLMTEKEDPALFHMNRRDQKVIDYIQPKSTVLDLGGGHGRLLYFLKKHKKVKGLTVDISKVATKHAKQKLGLDTEQADLEGYIPHKQYDYITMMGVLEHFPHPEKAMENVKGKFKKGLLIMQDNEAVWWLRIQCLLGNMPINNDFTHLHSWSKDDFIQWSKKLGYEVVDTISTYGIPILENIWPSMFSDQIIYVLKEWENSPRVLKLAGPIFKATEERFTMRG